jgi:hypothetical protein
MDIIFVTHEKIESMSPTLKFANVKFSVHQKRTANISNYFLFFKSPALRNLTIGVEPPQLHFLTILYEDHHDLLCRLIRNQNIRLPLKGD